MTNDTIAKLEEVKYMATRYEVVVVVDGKQHIVGYTARKTRESLLSYARNHLSKFITVDETTAVIWDSKMKRFNVEGVAACVEFSGRTQRGAIVEGAL